MVSNYYLENSYFQLLTSLIPWRQSMVEGRRMKFDIFGQCGKFEVWSLKKKEICLNFSDISVNSKFEVWRLYFVLSAIVHFSTQSMLTNANTFLTNTFLATFVQWFYIVASIVRSMNSNYGSFILRNRLSISLLIWHFSFLQRASCGTVLGQSC